ncbi:carbohydrate sulfotransferase 15-like [Mizuhopecten yessoensis]|uniref:Carbohydrate sulfotransferase 15 n=1 Tax=Mizuhopecten yessoensis TaxID=6573 RepID=A0A210QQG8_MIZYE|nr:carbohydrate sulfotransferase 15-like [Mizuhopecten yessoensis]XP_021352507.1 carbohydrate sulfotransferase 15-like [Mizuhopecten yessoensis]XP_021352508.1 carbohydrate sulfotransferase 15-like [Mizuhopecten yessoensis]XP_021352509.1 carbohydrate sulfotransferase 15-like [Mizuhopecten yessoensis]XP_021352511.1 carbohydrate sulfotransferase 15-like [Mizuhopecten yessoensis]XP_021352512.1 carbohydrate sulfotransferase 15-like [Mizuhopecten yessoensis]XP_021352513.1 carbohydrate sulfotransfer
MSHGLKRFLRSLTLTKWKPRFRMKTPALYVLFVSGAMLMCYMMLSQSRFNHHPVISKFNGYRKYAVHTMYGNGDGSGLTYGHFNKSAENDGNFTQSSVWVNPDLDLLHREQPNFLPNFKNPCWYERLYKSDVYKNNKYLVVSRSARHKSLELINEWSGRLSANRNTAQRLRCLPYFQVIGQPKCGSTDLFWRIMRHKDVFAPPIKELHWWSRNRQGKNINFTDIIPLSQYIDMFDLAALQIEAAPETDDQDVKYYSKILGEASVSTFWENDDWFHYPENVYNDEPVYTNADYVKKLLPDSKLILLLRNPIDRLFSDYLYFNMGKKSSEAFHLRMLNGIDVYRNCTETHSMRYCVYNRSVALQSATRLRVGLYVIYLRDWLKLFPREQLLILRLEDYSNDLAGVIKKVFSFLKLRKLSDSEFKHVIHVPIANKRKHKDKRVGQMLDKTKQILQEFYEPYNQELATLLGDDRFLWSPETESEENEDYDEDTQTDAHDKTTEDSEITLDGKPRDNTDRSSDDPVGGDEQVTDDSAGKGTTKDEEEGDGEEEDAGDDTLAYNRVKSAIKKAKLKSEYYYSGYN